MIDAWNVSADAVVFVDDSPLDIGEAVAVLPGVHGVRFPQDDAGLLPFLDELRALFGKRTATAEDRLRLATSRQAAAYRTAVAQADAQTDRTSSCHMSRRRSTWASGSAT